MFSMSRVLRGLLAFMACAAWVYAAFLTDKLYSYVAMQPALENHGWLAMGLRSVLGASVFVLALAVFSFVLMARRESGVFEFGLWVIAMIAVGIQLRSITPRFASKLSARVSSRPSTAPVPVAIQMSFQKSLRQSPCDVRVLPHAEVVPGHVERSAALQGAFLLDAVGRDGQGHLREPRGRSSSTASTPKPSQSLARVVSVRLTSRPSTR